MAKETNSFTKELLNGRQNGLKKVCNSVYGFFGVNEQNGVYPCKPIAAVTTLKGRAFIEATKNYVESNYLGCEVIYGDTDSVMIKCPNTMDLKQANCLGEKLSIEITNKLQNGEISLGGAGKMFKNLNTLEKQNKRILDACSAMNLAFEKVYFPYLLLKKKRYAGMKHIQGKVTMEMKGIDCIRRDRPKLLRDISLNILNTILLKNCEDTQLAKGLLADYLQKIVNKELNIDFYILSKSIKANYANDNLPHIGALKRMQERGEETPPIGTRIHFIVTNSEKEKLYDRTEHPSYVELKNLEIDYLYYIDSLFTPLFNLLKYIFDEDEIIDIFQKSKDVILYKNQTNLFGLLKRKHDNHLEKNEEEIIKFIPIKKKSVVNTLKNYFN
jgi:DNA polymerase delta subunit 1